MIFSKIPSIKYKPEFKILIYLVVFTLIMPISGCATSETQRISSENIPYKMNYKIINVIMKNGNIIDLQDKTALFFREYNNKQNVIVYTATDTVNITTDSLRISQITKVIELDDVKKVTIEKSSTASAVPFILAGLVVILIILLSISPLRK